MTGRLQKEIRQTRPFRCAEEEAFLNIVRTAEVLGRGAAELLKGVSLSPTQYNVLRILRGAGDAGHACRGIAERLVTHDPDITRLLDRLEERHLVNRTRDERDRRVVTTRITDEGLRLLAELDEPMTSMHVGQLSHLGPERLQSLIELLEAARDTAP